MPLPVPPPSLRGVVAALVAAASAVSVPLAHAQSKTLGGGKSSGGPLLSRSELRECLAGQDRIKARRQETQQLQDALARDKAEIARRGEALQAKLETLDRSNAEQVEQYNAEAAERDRLIDAYEARVGGYNTQAEALNVQSAAWKRTCENRRYDEKDELAIQAGK